MIMEIDYPIDRWKQQIDNFQGEFTLSLTHIGFFVPNMLTEIRCYIDYITSLKKNLNILFPTDLPSEDYAGRMGLFEGVNEYKYKKTKHISDRFIPLYKIDSDSNEDISFQILETFKEAGAPSVPNLATSISELLDNIYYHSNIEYGTGTGFVAAQIYENHHSPHLEISIRDIGVGIVQSYIDRDQNKEKSEIELFKGAFDELNSSTGQTGRGQGLTHAIDFIKSCHGSMVMNSGNFNAIISSGGKLKFSKIGTYKEGTEIKITVPYDKN